MKRHNVMSIIKKNPLFLTVLLIATISLACQTFTPGSQPAETESPKETSISAQTVPVPTATTLPPTLTIEIPEYPDFPKVELLPGDIFQTSAAFPRNMNIETTIMRPYGGGRGPCIKNPDLPAITGVYLEYPVLFLCEAGESNEAKAIDIALGKPDGSADTFVQQVVPGERYCLDSLQTLSLGKYAFDISSSGYTATGEFNISNAPRVFVGGGGVYRDFEAMCATSLAKGDDVQIFFTGFAPSQVVEVLFYTSLGWGIDDYHYQTSWTAEMDEKGYLMQYVPTASFPEGTEFVFVVSISNPAPDAIPMMTLSPNPQWVYTAMLLPKQP